MFCIHQKMSYSTTVKTQLSDVWAKNTNTLLCLKNNKTKSVNSINDLVLFILKYCTYSFDTRLKSQLPFIKDQMMIVKYLASWQ